LPDEEDDLKDSEDFSKLIEQVGEFTGNKDGYGGDGDSEGDEEPIDFDGEDDYNTDEESEDNFASPIDLVDELIFFVDQLQALSRTDNSSYQKLFGQLDNKNKETLQVLFAQGEERRLKLQQEKIQQQ